MDDITYEGCTITQPCCCTPSNSNRPNETAPWDGRGETKNTGCWKFTEHSILCNKDITADTIHIRFYDSDDSDDYYFDSRLGFNVQSLDADGNRIGIVLAAGNRTGLIATESLDPIPWEPGESLRATTAGICF